MELLSNVYSFALADKKYTAKICEISRYKLAR